MRMHVSKAFKGSQHVGWKKNVAGKPWFLVYGTTPADEAKAISLATALEAKWQLAKLAGNTELTQSDYDEARVLVGIGRSANPAISGPVVVAGFERSTVLVREELTRPTSSVDGGPRRWLYPCIDEFVATTKRGLKPDGSNGDHVFNTCERILRARDAIRDVPLDLIRRKELDDWLLEIRALPSKLTGKPLGPVTIRNIVGGVRAALIKFAEWEWWTPPPLWERAFKGYSIKKLQTPADRKRHKKRPPAHSITEKRVLWHLATPFTKSMMAMADWAGHTQKEVATLTFDEIVDNGQDMYVERDRHKTGVHGRWWIPPEAAAVIRKIIARTPRDPRINPDGLAFLTPAHQPLVHRAEKNKRSRSDYVGNNLWTSLLRSAKHYGVRHISYKYMRKGAAQLIRDAVGKEVSRIFLAHADEDVQDENYTRASIEKVEKAVRALYPQLRAMFDPITINLWAALRTEIQQESGLSAEYEVGSPD